MDLDANNLAAAQALIPLYEEKRDFAKYARVLTVQLEHTDDAESKLEQIKVLATLHEEKLRQSERAFELYLQAIELDPESNFARGEVERLAEQACRWRDLVDCFERVIPRVLDPVAQAALMTTVAAVYERQLGDPESALRTNQQILESDPDNSAAIEALERLYTATEQWEQLLEVCRRKLDRVENDTERKQIYYQIAFLYEEELRQPEQAADAYRAVLDMGGDDTKALRALQTIYESEGRLDRPCRYGSTTTDRRRGR